MKKISFILLALFVMPVFALALTAGPVMAATNIPADTYWGNNSVAQNINDSILLGQKDPREIAAEVINVILGFLGIVAVIIILAGGFKWMTAGGNQDKVDEAKKLMAAGAIGLVIVLAAFGIARFLISSLITATTTP
ncbi:MAG: pilin [Patescibacteria group bacterium]|jgi:small-conductance mechanosensitive channel